MSKFKDWHQIEELGSGGQSTVFLVRRPERAAQLASATETITLALRGQGFTPGLFAKAVVDASRVDNADELGALKLFDKVRHTGPIPAERIRREIEILKTGHAGFPKLLDEDANENWMVTEYFPSGSLDKSPGRFKGNVFAALKEFRALVETVADLHKRGIIHRDIKPANVFIGKEGRLILGDFGIAFRNEGTERATVTDERVGPWDYMPQWADTGERLENIKASFDIYMLGKLLWCMISGKLRLPREYHRRDEYNLARLFSGNRRMHSISSVLDKCIVENESECLQSAGELLKEIDLARAEIDSPVYLNERGEAELPCLLCGKGKYLEETTGGKIRLEQFDSETRLTGAIEVRVFSCNVCTHRAFFSLRFPEKAIGAESSPPKLPNTPLPDKLRVALGSLYDALQRQYQSSSDTTVLNVIGPAVNNISSILTKDNLYRFKADAALLQALATQIDITSANLRALETQIRSTASHFTFAGSLLEGIEKVLSLIP